MIPTMETQKETAGKALYTLLGAPVVTSRKLRDFGARVAGDFADETVAWEAEGRKLTGQIQESKVVDQVQQRVDYEQLQEQVEKLRDQLETVLVNWRVGFTPARPAKKAEATAPVKPATKTAPKKTTAKKTTAKKTTAKKTTAKKTTAKKPTTPATPAATKTST